MGRFRFLAVARALACSVVLLAATACTGSSSSAPPTAPADRSSSAAENARSAEPVQLSCADAASGDTPSGAENLTLAGLTLEGLHQPVDQVPVAPGGNGQRLRKAPAYLPAGTGPVTVELVAPASGQALLWVPAGEWSNRPDLLRWMTTKLTLQGCADHDATYLGGVLASQPDSCLRLRVQAAGGRVEAQQLRLDGRPC